MNQRFWRKNPNSKLVSFCRRKALSRYIPWRKKPLSACAELTQKRAILFGIFGPSNLPWQSFPFVSFSFFFFSFHFQAAKKTGGAAHHHQSTRNSTLYLAPLHRQDTDPPKGQARFAGGKTEAHGPTQRLSAQAGVPVMIHADSSQGSRER